MQQPIGLTDIEVEERVSSGKVNHSIKQEKLVLNVIFTNVFSWYNYLFFFILIFLLSFYVFTRDMRLLLDSFGVFSLVVVNTGISIFEELRARKALQKVSLLLQKTVSVIRNNEKIQIPNDNIVVDDILYIENGDQIVVDGEIIESTMLEIDESLLTGESEPVNKDIGDNVLSGSFVISGTAYFKVTKFGEESFAGKITSVAKGFKFTRTPLQNKILVIIKIMFVVAAILIILKVGKYFPDQIFSVDSIRSYTTIIIGLIPQGLIFLSTITYALGIYRISKIGAIIQKTSAIEAFSGVDIICTDKTGTLTQNKLSVTEISYYDTNEKEYVDRLLGTYAKAVSFKNATSETLNVFPFFENYELIDELPFNSKLKLSAVRLRIEDNVKVYVLGAYDVLLPKSDRSFHNIDENKIKVYRNLLFGEIDNSNIDITTIKNGADFSINPIAVISISDTVRSDSINVIKLFHEKNIDVKILSGDSPFAVQAIAQKIGWDINDNDLVTGDELSTMNEKEFCRVIYSKKIFARLIPEHKQRIVEQFQKDKHFVSMIGDGVNDLPAIKKSDLGIAMQEGSQITKDISDIILVENKFSLLPDIFNEGNKIVNSIRYSARLFLTKNLFTALMTLLTIFTSLPFTLTPRKISFLNIFAITLPSFFLTLYNDDIVGRKKFIRDIFAAIVIPAVVFIVCSYSNYYLAETFFPNINESQKLMIVVTTIAMLAVINFVSISVFSTISKTNKLILSFLGLGLILLFFLIIYIDFLPLRWFKELYEVTSLNIEHLILVAIMSIIGSAVIFLTSYLKEKLLYKYWQ